MSIETELQLRDEATKVVAEMQTVMDKLLSIVNVLNTKDILSTEKIKDAKSEVKELEQSVLGVSGSIKSVGFISGIGGAIGGIIGSIAGNIVNNVIDGIKQGAKDVINWSDEITTTKARLDLINDGLMTTDQLLNNIKNVSLESRTNFNNVADSVAKLKLNTGDLFANNAETLLFVENLTKGFKIAGTSADNVNNAMTQLEQALSSGALQGDEFRSLKDYAPNVLDALTDYMGVTRGQLKDLGSEGKITSEVLKNAILGATEELDEQFKKIPPTFEDISTQFKTIASYSFLPIQEEIMSIAGTISTDFLPELELFMSSIGIIVAEYIGFIKDIAKGVGEFIKPIFEPINKLFSNFNTVGKKAIKEITGETVTTLQSVQIFTQGYMIFLTTIFKKTGNVIFNLADILVGAVAITVGVVMQVVLTGVQKVAGVIDNIGEKFGKNWNLSGAVQEDIKFWEDFNQKFNTRMKEYDNYFSDDYFGKSLKDVATESLKDATKDVLGNYNDFEEILKKTDDGLGDTTTELKDLSDGLGNVSSATNSTSKNLDDFNKVVMEYREATYHNNVANQFNGNISITTYGVDEEGQKAIGKATEEAIRKVFLNDYQNTQAMGVYA